MISDQGRWEEVSIFDPLYRRTITSLNPTYASRLQQALDTGLDNDAAGVFTYVSEVDEDLDDNNDEDNDQDDDVSVSSSTHTSGSGHWPHFSTVHHDRAAFTSLLDT